MASSNMRVAATRLPKERLAQLDRLASRRRVTRSTLVRDAIEHLLGEGEEPLTREERDALDQRREYAALVRKVFSRRHRRR